MALGGLTMAPMAADVLTRGSPREVQLRAWNALRAEQDAAADHSTQQSCQQEAAALVHPPVSEAAVFRAMLQKNWRLKTRGVICCCSGASFLPRTVLQRPLS